MALQCGERLSRWLQYFFDGVYIGRMMLLHGCFKFSRFQCFKCFLLNCVFMMTYFGVQYFWDMFSIRRLFGFWTEFWYGILSVCFGFQKYVLFRFLKYFQCLRLIFSGFWIPKKSIELFDVRLCFRFILILPCIAGKGQRLKIGLKI